MEKLPGFSFRRPRSLSEALSIVDEEKGRSALFAGGTDLLVLMKRKQKCPAALIDLKGIDELQGLSVRGNTLRVGACVTMNALQPSEAVRTHAPILREAAARVGSRQIRSRATVGGNLCNASPAADVAVALLAMGAILIVKNQTTSRSVSIDDFFKGPGETVLENDEILEVIEVPCPVPGTFHVFSKYTIRREMDLAITNMGVMLNTDEGGHVRRARIAFGAVAPTPIRMKSVERMLEGSAITEEMIDHACSQVLSEINPISDLRASADYRGEITRVLLRRGLQNIRQDIIKAGDRT